MDAVEFLELLARDAAPVEFERPLVAARAAGVSAEELHRIEHAKGLALQVRATLETRRRRETELAALFDTANDLAMLTDVDAVLEAIVHRARQLLHSDVAYLTVNDEVRGDTYMRVTEGAVSPAFRAVRLPMGAGLGGLVAQTATPYSTADYFEDERFRHTVEIDSAVREEGVTSILGVPLQLGKQVIGVLYAANRTVRPFGREDAALLVSLAAHAAIAIDNARLLGETQAALTELELASEMLRARTESVERAAEAHDRLTRIVLQGGGVEDVVRSVSEVLGGRVVVIDPAGAVLAASTGADTASEQEVEAVRKALDGSRTTASGGVYATPMAAGADQLGAMLLEPLTPVADSLDEGDQRILERSALVTALLLLFRRSVAEAEGRVRGELLEDLLSGTARDPEALRERARLLGADLTRPYAVVVAQADGDRARLGQAAAYAAATHDGFAAVRQGHVVFMLPDRDARSAAQRVAEGLRHASTGPVTVGAAGPVTGAAAGNATDDRGPAGAGIVAGYEEARRCLQELLALGREGQVATAADLGFVGLLLGSAGGAEGYVSSQLGPVIDYDAQKGSKLVATLEEWFAADRNLTRTAAALHVHVNTVTQRLDRVTRLLGRGWQEPERQLEVQLALRLHRLVG